MLSRHKTVFFVFLFVAVMAFLPAVCMPAENTIGVIMPGDIPYHQVLHSAFMARLSRSSYAANTEIIVQKPYPDPISLSNAARKFIAMDVDAIVVYGGAAALAVLNEKTKIPMVYAAVYDPLTARFRSKTVTGVSSKLSVSSPLRYLRAMTRISVLGIIYSSGEDDSVYQMKELMRLAEQYGFKAEEINLRRHQDAKAMLSTKRFDALFVTGSAVAHLAMPAILEISRQWKIPVASFMLDRGSQAVISVFTSPVEQGGKAADKTVRILDGVHPEKIRPDQANQTELVFNLREAAAMGLKLPMELVTEATRIIK